MENLNIWNQVKAVPAEAQKKIKGGRLSGMTDISPMWRIAKMTEVFGICGIGWRYEITDQRLERVEDQVVAFTNINLFVKVDGEWSAPIVGTGGSMLAAKEKSGVYVSDEAFKMSLTDALSVAMKALGVGAEVYSAGQDFTKNSVPVDENPFIDDTQIDVIDKMVTAGGVDLDAFLKYMNAPQLTRIKASDYTKAVSALKKKLAERGK
jgi:hypothetical protein